MKRRSFLTRGASALAGALTAGRLPLAAQPRPQADYTLRIAPIRLEIAPGKIVKTTAINGRVPGDLIRVPEGREVTIDVVNETGAPDILHWHGLHIPSEQDGAEEEGSPMVAPHGGIGRFTFAARPAGSRWYHTHNFAGHNLNRATFTGEFGFLMIDPAADPARYDQEIFLALHDWNGYIEGGAEGYQEVLYNRSTINDRMFGFGEPVRVRQGQRVLFHFLNASATLTHTLALAGHRFLVTALDGNPVPSPAQVETLVLGPAERVDTVVEMNAPGIWVLGETDPALRRAGMGIVVEYAGRSGTPEWRQPAAVDFRYELFGPNGAGQFDEAKPDEAKPGGAKPGGAEQVIPLVFKPKFEGYGDFDHWTINGLSWPHTKQIALRQGSRYRLILDNQSTDIHPVHLHRHSFELRSVAGKPMAGIFKDVVLLPTHSRSEVVFTAGPAGKTLFHCHQQDHMDSGFMMLFNNV